MFTDEVNNRVHFEWLRGKWIVCQKWERWMPYTSEDIKQVDCDECLRMYPHLYWDAHDRPSYDIRETGTWIIDDDDDPELPAAWGMGFLPDEN